MKHYFALLLTLFFFTAKAQNPFVERYNVSYLNMSTGLPSNYVDDIYGDSYGFIWIATHGGGLVRYDGFNYMYFGIGNQGMSLRSNTCHNITEDHFHRLWISFEEYTEVLDLTTLQSVLPIDKTNQLVKILREQSVKTFCDSKGAMWVVTLCKIYHITFDEKGHVATIENLNYRTNTPDVMIADVEGNSTVWAAIDGGLYKLIPHKGKLIRQNISKEVTHLSGLFIQSIKKVNNHLWMATSNGLYILDKKGKIVKIYRTDNRKSSLSHNSVTDIALDNNNHVMLGTLDGVDLYDPKSDGFIHWSSNSKKYPLPSNFVNCLFLKNGIIWVGTESGGIVKLNPRQLVLHNYVHSAAPGSISANCVNSIYADNDGTLWIGTVEGGLNRLDPGKNSFVHYTTANSGLSHNSVSTIASDDNGHLWIGTWAGGINIMNKNNASTVHRLSVPHEYTTLLNYIGALIYDPYNKGMWIGSNDGIFFYNYATKTISDPFPGCRNIRGAIGSIIDKDGTLWMGFLKGMICVNLKSRDKKGHFKYRVLTNKLDNPKSGIIDKICSFCQSKDGTLWLGSNGYGLYHREVDQQGHESFKVYTMKNGLPNNSVKGIVEDKNGKLWLTTDNGLSHFDPKTGMCYNYYQSDGLITNQFYWNSAVNGPNGSILLGGTEGFTILEGDNSMTLYQGHLRFTRLSVANQIAYADGRYMDQDISIADEIHLHEGDKSIEISFSALNYGPETQGVYSYRLKGFDDDWTQLPAGQNSVRYTNLPSGHYQFEVKYVSTLNDTNDAVITLGVIVSPYFWKSWWFVTIVLIVSLSVVKYLYDKHVAELRYREAERLMKPIVDALKNSEEPEQLQGRIENILLTQHRIKASLKKSVEADRIDVKTFMERLTEIMEKNYSNAEFDVNSLAESLDVRRSALCKIISAETGESTSKFMRSYRLEIAKDMLLKNDANRNVAQIAFKVGFNDPKYFTRCFTKKFGVTPSFFMK